MFFITACKTEKKVIIPEIIEFTDFKDSEVKGKLTNFLLAAGRTYPVANKALDSIVSGTGAAGGSEVHLEVLGFVHMTNN